MMIEKNDRVLLLVMPVQYERELKEANRTVPKVGEIGTVVDMEPCGWLIPHDSVEVKFEKETCWLPMFMFRKLPR